MDGCKHNPESVVWGERLPKEAIDNHGSFSLEVKLHMHIQVVVVVVFITSVKP